MTLTITLSAAKHYKACEAGLAPVRAHLGADWPEDKPFPLLVVLEHGQGMDDTLWALRCVPPEQEDDRRRIVSLWLADVLERVESTMTDPRSRAVIPALRRHAGVPLSREEWKPIISAAYAAAHAAAAADAAAYAAAAAAAAHAAAHAAYAAAAAHAAAAHAANYAAERAWQPERLRHYLQPEA